MAQQETTTRDKLLVFGMTGAFMSLTIVLGYFLSPGSWSPAITTAAASYLVVSIVVAAGAGIRVLYRGLEDPSSSPSRRLLCRLAGGPRRPFHDARGTADAPEPRPRRVSAHP